MSENPEEVLRRLAFIHTMGMIFVGAGTCPGCKQKREVFDRRRTIPKLGKERCLDCWRAER